MDFDIGYFLKKVPNQRAGRAFSLRAGDADNGARTVAKEELSDRSDFFFRGGDELGRDGRSAEN